jgi:hypothetical protein
LPSEQALIGHGVSSCATCDGFFFRGREIAVVGGGDSAMEEALFPHRFASKVTLLHRRVRLSAPRRSCWSAPGASQDCAAPQHVIEEVLGVDEKEVKGVRLRDVATGRGFDAGHRGLFLGIGHEPNAKMFAGQIDLDGDGYIKTKQCFDHAQRRWCPGVFACGDVQDRRYRQAITAAGSGCMGGAGSGEVSRSPGARAATRSATKWKRRRSRRHQAHSGGGVVPAQMLAEVEGDEDAEDHQRDDLLDHLELDGRKAPRRCGWPAPGSSIRRRRCPN